MKVQNLSIAAVLALLVVRIEAHGQMTLPTGRNGGTLERAGDCLNYECFWFSQITTIPGAPKVNDEEFRTFNVNISSGPLDWSAQMPWRAPGTAPVIGSGCGSAGGGPTTHDNGGIPPPGIKQGADFLTLPPNDPVTWKRGSVQEVAWGIFANHGGGYSWRLCKNEVGKVNEECFLKNTLDFVGDTQWLRFAPVTQWDQITQMPEYEIPRVTVNVGTYPRGAQWARNPMPACYLCNQAYCMPNKTWEEQQHCSQACSGLNISHCPPGTSQFPEPLPGVSGYYTWKAGDDNGLSGYKFNIVDKVKIPELIEPGKYLLSWRWDCEQSRQIWQNCADIIIE